MARGDTQYAGRSVLQTADKGRGNPDGEPRPKANGKLLPHPVTGALCAPSRAAVHRHDGKRGRGTAVCRARPRVVLPPGRFAGGGKRAADGARLRDLLSLCATKGLRQVT
jgi:hypothetical protein